MAPYDDFPEDDEDDAGRKPCPVLPAGFWDSRSHPFLAQIRQAAQHVECVPDAVLHSVLANVAVLAPYDYFLPGKRIATLDFFTAVIGSSGDGKGTAMEAADRLVRFFDHDDDHAIRTRALGSGEGMAQQFFDREDVPNDNGNGSHKENVRTALAVKFQADEGAAYSKLADRSGQTTGPLIRSMWFGERLGGTYVGASKNCQLRPRQYRAVLVLGLQIETCAPVLAEYTLGTPQRALWSTPVNPDLPDPDSLPIWPGPLRWKPDPLYLKWNPEEFREGREIPVHDEVIQEVRWDSWRRRTGRVETTKYDGHRELLTLKVAGLLGYLRTGSKPAGEHEGRPEVGRSDWKLAKQVVAASDQVRAWVEDQIEEVKRRKLAGQIEFAAQKAGAARAAEIAVEDDSHKRVRDILLNAHRRHPGLRRAELIKRKGKRYSYQEARQAMAELEAEGLVSWPDDEEGTRG